MIETICKNARLASRELATLLTAQKNDALNKMADALETGREKIFEANRRDMEAGEANGLTSAMLDRLLLNETRVKSMADGLREIAHLPDPVGEVSEMKRRPNGMMVGRMRVPLGVVGIIYESRPNVTADTAALCLKSGNAVILRGGSEAINSNKAIASILKEAVKSAGITDNAIQIIPTTDRVAVARLLKMDKYIDIIIPRGGYDLIRFVTENSLIPVVKHDKGVCHIYVDAHADVEMGVNIALNAKGQRPGVCNAMETLLVHEKIADEFLPAMARRFESAGIEMRGCEKTCAIVKGAIAATEEDWDEEYLDLIIAIKVVQSFDEAVDHIADHGSGHTETIVTNDYLGAQEFLKRVDSSTVMVNASTRFSDGGQFGLGAELGISTQKLHVRGPMGLNDLTSLKYIVYGTGNIRE
ncbi:Gamma-glutamyl phosphate reductase [hydrothermal vent metagenome]|uniref:glutamate-5-semialdehyde dehydrogenase n=1 Tax=hydrothermal vent metagenome TaxID=652676 RepID=A0A3B1D883_9ZZZZ